MVVLRYKLLFLQRSGSHCFLLTSDFFSVLCPSQPWLAVVRAWKKYWIGNWCYSSTVALFLLEAVLKGSQPPEECWEHQSKVDFKRNNCLLSSLSATCVHLIMKSLLFLADSIAACDAFVVDWPLLTFSFC